MSNSGIIIFFTVLGLSCVTSSSSSSVLMLNSGVAAGEESIRIAGYGDEKLSTVIVTGALLCTSCTSHRRFQLLPISGAQVAVACNSRSSHSHYSSSKKGRWVIRGMTNNNGELSIDMPSHLHAIPDLHKACSLKVLSLPKHSPCRSAAFKHRGHGLVLSWVANGIRSYSAGTLKFRPHGSLQSLKRCKTETHTSY